MYDTVNCPYCNAENDMSDALCDGLNSDNKFDWECQECEKEFEVYVESEPSFTASKIKYIKCDRCVRKALENIVNQDHVFHFLKHLKESHYVFNVTMKKYSKNMLKEIRHNNMKFYKYILKAIKEKDFRYIVYGLQEPAYKRKSKMERDLRLRVKNNGNCLLCNRQIHSAMVVTPDGWIEEDCIRRYYFDDLDKAEAIIIKYKEDRLNEKRKLLKKYDK